ncbi:MAG: adenylosuccinate lyase, partial [Actinomycetia bacterium]|nr:adenylosuccinate lyase [Actinomycetes bacterium]
SQRVLLTLIGKGLSREKAYLLVQRNAMASWKEKRSFKALLLNDDEVKGCLSEQEVDSCFEVAHYLENIDKIFARVDS